MLKCPRLPEEISAPKMSPASGGQAQDSLADLAVAVEAAAGLEALAVAAGGPGRGPRGNSRFRGSNFGNHRRPSQLHGMASFQLSNSAVNAKPFSITGQDVVQPSYAQSRFSLILGGPLMIPKLVKDPSTFFFISYFGTRNRNPFSAVATVPTELERAGDFSQSLQSGGPLQIFNPATHQPFPGNVIPANQLNPIALNLLRYVPLPNQPGLVNNYQFLYSPAQNTDNFGLRLQRNMGAKDRLAYQLNYQNRSSQKAQTYQFLDALDGSGIRTGLTWTHNLTPLALNSLQFTFNRNNNQALPFFANGPDVAAELGIQGTSTNSLNYGPPNLSFTNFGSLTDSSFTLSRNQSQGLGDNVVLTKGQHTISFGVQFQRNDLSTETDQNGRGAFTFTGLATSAIGANGQPVANTGFDLADYLLGLPEQASITYGNSSLYFNQNVWSAYVQDDFRVHPRFTILAGLRYEYFQPLSGEVRRSDEPGHRARFYRRSGSDPAIDRRAVYRSVPCRPDQLGLQQLRAARRIGMESARHQTVDRYPRGLRDLLQRAGV